jgi:hypothetical protein
MAFEMGRLASQTWGCGVDDIPVTGIEDYPITPVPYIQGESRSFTDEMELSLANVYPDAEIFFDFGDAKSLGGFHPYSRPLVIKEDTWLRGYAIKNQHSVSPVIGGHFNRMPQGRSIEIKHPCSSQYTAGGDQGLIDLLRGGENFRTGFWQGYQGVDLDAIVDLGVESPLKKISAGFLQDQRSWIFMPEYVEVSVSLDGNNYVSLGKVDNDIPMDREGAVTRDFVFNAAGNEIRYIKVYAKNIGICPEWHPGSGNPSWIFIDEIMME